MKFTIKKGKLFWLYYIFILCIVIVFIAYGGLKNLKDTIDVLFIIILLFVLPYLAKNSYIIFDDEYLIVQQGFKKDYFAYINISDLVKKRKRITILYGPDRIRFTYLVNDKIRIYEIAPDQVDECLRILTAKIQERNQ